MNRVLTTERGGTSKKAQLLLLLLHYTVLSYYYDIKPRCEFNSGYIVRLVSSLLRVSLNQIVYKIKLNSASVHVHNEEGMNICSYLINILCLIPS